MVEELKEQRDMFNAERKSMEVMSKQWTKEKESLLEQKQELNIKIKQIDDENKNALQRLREKYESAKKTAKTYKVIYKKYQYKLKT